MVRDLRTLAIDGFIAMPRRGVEVGGLLFGDARDRDVRLTAFEEVRCEHRYGPSYALSEEDRAKLKELLAERRSRHLPVAGFFRSFTSREPVIEAADEQFVREQFPAGVFVFLMLKPLSAEDCVATLRFFTDGRLLPETEDPPAAFDSRQMPVADLSAAPAASPVNMRAPEPPVPVDTPPPAVEPPRMEGPRLVRRELPPRPRAAISRPPEYSAPAGVGWGVVAAIGLFSLLGGAVAARLWMGTPSERWAELHLDARPTGQRLDVTWDAAAAQGLGAAKGLLAVTEGEAHRDIPLDQAQIRAGKYSLATSQIDVGVRLILYSQGRGAAGDAVRVAAVPVGSIRRQAPDPGNADRSAHIPAPPPVAAESAPPPARSAEVPSAPSVAPSPAASSGVPSGAKAAPPSAIHEVQPKIPDGIRSRMTRQVVIPVEVQVDAKGRVVRAVATARNSDAVGRYLSEQAQKAAREWRFTPARTDAGEQVAASTTLRFVFTP